MAHPLPLRRSSPCFSSRRTGLRRRCRWSSARTRLPYWDRLPGGRRSDGRGGELRASKEHITEVPAAGQIGAPRAVRLKLTAASGYSSHRDRFGHRHRPRLQLSEYCSPSRRLGRSAPWPAARRGSLPLTGEPAADKTRSWYSPAGGFSNVVAGASAPGIESPRSRATGSGSQPGSVLQISARAGGLAGQFLMHGAIGGRRPSAHQLVPASIGRRVDGANAGLRHTLDALAAPPGSVDSCWR